MKFFNPKEEVIDIQLTQYGKGLLAMGRLKPAYYAFFDNDILYDGTYAGAPRHQNEIVPRIKNDTPRLRTQAHFDHSDEGNIATTYGWVTTPTGGWSYSMIEHMVDYAMSEIKNLGMPLGNSEYSNNYAPSWDVQYLYGELTSAINHYSGSIQESSIPTHGGAGDLALSQSLPYWQIPQLKSTIEWETFVTYYDYDGQLVKDYIPSHLQDIAADLSTDFFVDEEDQDRGPGEHLDGSVIQVKPDFLLLEINENNVEFLKENFDIEVFELQTALKADGRTYDVERRLRFFDPNIDEDVDERHVEYWFDILVDEEIPPEYFCASDVIAIKKKKLRTDESAIYPDCPDLDDTRDLYKKDLEDVGEPC